MWLTLLAAFALMLVLEGLTPFLFPQRWRDMLTRLLALNDGQIRFFGLTAMIVGLMILFATGLF